MAEIYQLPDNQGNNGGGFGTTPMPKLEEKDFETEIENKAE